MTIFRCFVEKSESFVIVCKVFLFHCHWRFVIRMCFLVRMENCKVLLLPRGFVIICTTLPWFFFHILQKFYLTLGFRHNLQKFYLALRVCHSLQKFYLTLGFCHMRTNLPTFQPAPSCQTCWRCLQQRWGKYICKIRVELQTWKVGWIIARPKSLSC